MRGPPETILDDVVVGDGEQQVIVRPRRLANVDYSEYEWMGDEGVEEFDRKCMEELWAEEFMDMALENVLEDDSEELCDFLFPLYENMMQQMGAVCLADGNQTSAKDDLLPLPVVAEESCDAEDR